MDQRVHFYTDLAAALHQLKKLFDLVCQELRNQGIQQGLIHPARLLVTHGEHAYIFKTPAQDQEFVKKDSERHRWKIDTTR